MARTLAEIDADLARLYIVRASGTSQVDFADGRSVRYDVNDAIAALLVERARLGAIRRIFPVVDRGLF
jgi:hypothetical protein